MRILITNHALVERAGTELYVRDLAEGLLRRGHSPIAYSTKLGQVAEELRKATVPVVDNLSALSVPPDLIHGQHHIETMTALLHFPKVPAVYFCHGWLAWEETPPRFPRIKRYVAVDDTCRDRLISEQGIPVEKISVIGNFVDLERFKARSPLPRKPQNALVFSNNASESTHLPAVREACRRAGLSLDVVGLESGEVSAHPESLLGAYDIVFAKARCAFEAMAVGTAVVLCDASGVGPMVTSVEFEKLRRFNFGVRTLREPVRPEIISRELDRYDPQDAAEVSKQLRASSGQYAAFHQLIALYEEVLAEGGQEESSAACESQFVAAYLRDVSLHLTRQREAIYRSTSYRLGNMLVKTPLVSSIARRVSRKWAQ